MIIEEEIQIYIDTIWKKKTHNIIDYLLVETLIRESLILVEKSVITKHKCLQLIDNIIASHTKRRNILPKDWQ
jgi:hypothetical protein